MPASKRLHRAATVVAFVLAAIGFTASASAAGESAHVMGSAAGGLGVSGAIADFNADGRPDIAVADRVGAYGGADYELSVHMSGGATQIVRFRSTQHLLAVTAVDIDHDNDLDLVFTPVLGREIERVWLNDGQGHFSAGPIPSQPSQSPELRSLVVLMLRSTAVAVSPRSAGAAVSGAPGTLADAPVHLLPDTPSASRAFLGSSLALRGPPPVIAPASV